MRHKYCQKHGDTQHIMYFNALNVGHRTLRRSPLGEGQMIELAQRPNYRSLTQMYLEDLNEKTEVVNFNLKENWWQQRFLKSS